jgi:hypothetical protein
MAENPLLSDEKKVKMIVRYFDSHPLSLEELQKAMSHFLHEISRVNCFREIYRKAEDKDSLLPIVGTFRFFSYKRLLVAEFGIDLDRAQIEA